MKASDIVKAPKLDADKHVPELPLRCLRERFIVANLIAHLGRAGFAPTAVNDGGETIGMPVFGASSANVAKRAMEAVFAVDDAQVYFEKPGFKGHWVLLIGGNDEDIISDWTYSHGDPDGFNAAMDAFDASEYLRHALMVI